MGPDDDARDGAGAVTAQQALKAALGEVVVPMLRSRGYKGSSPTWTHTNALGDVAVINVQSSSSSTSEELRCVINLAVAPEPWLALKATQMDKPVPKAVKEYHGLFRDRLEPSARDPRGSESWWRVSDARTARVAVEDMAERLKADGLDRLDGLLDRATFLDAVRGGDLGMMKAASLPVFFDWARAALLADEGSSEELAALLRKMAARELTQGQAAQRELLEWVDDRVALMSARPSS